MGWGSPLTLLVVVRRPFGQFPFCLIDIGLLRFGHDAPTLRDLGSIVRRSHLVMKELALHIANQAHQLARLGKQPALRIELLNSLGEGAKESLEVAGAPFIVSLFRLIRLVRHVGCCLEVWTTNVTPMNAWPSRQRAREAMVRPTSVKRSAIPRLGPSF